MIKTIGFIGDTHCGSHYGLWPEKDLPKDKSKYAGVRYLNKCYAQLVRDWPDLDLLVLMGDLVDGPQYKSKSVGVFSASMGDQAKAAIEVLKPLANKAKRVFRVWGTPYHEGFDDCLNVLDIALGVSVIKQVVDLDLGAGILNIAHHPGGGPTLYKGTSLDKEVVWATVAAARGKLHKPRWIIRAHKHEFGMQSDEDCTIVGMPCFQLPTPHSVKGNYWRWQPSIGGVLMIRDDSEDGCYRFRANNFEVPKQELTR